MPIFAGIDVAGVRLQSATLTWDVIRRMPDVTKMKILIKGLEDREDALLALANGCARSLKELSAAALIDARGR